MRLSWARRLLMLVFSSSKKTLLVCTTGCKFRTVSEAWGTLGPGTVTCIISQSATPAVCCQLGTKSGPTDDSQDLSRLPNSLVG